MKHCFVDTSAFYAVLDADDKNHARACPVWEELVGTGAVMVTTSYVLVETSALLQHRLGIEAVQAFQEDIYPLLNIEWLGAETHEAGMAAVLTARRKNLSLVDCVSFDVMRRRGLGCAFTFDAHFAEQGFECIPE